MQNIYRNNTNENLLSQHDNGFYNQYSHENQSLSPQQSSTSDIDEISPIPSSSTNRINNSMNKKKIKKKKQTKRKRKDPNEPQKPVSPYALFFRDTQNDIKKKLSNPSFGEISKVVAHMWENIEPEVKEQYKHKAATAKKEYLKQLAAYRAVQISHQTPNMHHLLNQSPLSFNPYTIQSQQRSYHTGSIITNHQQYSPSTSIQQYNNFHYINPYNHDNSNIYHTDRSINFPNYTHQNYSSYDSDYQQYNILRPTIESEHYSSYYSQTSIDNEHIKSNDNNTSKYVDLISRTNGHNTKHYHHHHGLNDKKEDDHSSLIPMSNENNFHWNQTTNLSREW